MEKYAVLKQIGSFTPSVAEVFNNVDDAIAYRDIMNRKHDGWTYEMFEMCDVIAPVIEA